MITPAEPAAEGTRGPERLTSPGFRAPSRVTVKDVARVAGVTPGTVSKSLNDSREVSEPTRLRVLEAAARLGYRPNTIARSLKVRRTHTVGVITDDLEGVFTTAMVRGVEEIASGLDFGVFVCNSYGTSAKERQHLELLLDKQVDGIILMSGQRVAERGNPAIPVGQTPIVYLYQYTSVVDAPCIIPDDAGGASLSTRHLLGLGRRRIAFINGPPQYEATHLRHQGYRQAIAQAGQPYDPALVRVASDWYQDTAFTIAQELMTLDPPPDGIVCANDDLAAGAILGLRESGYHVPTDVSVMGFDDRAFAAHLPIPLSTVALPFYEMGLLAARRLFGALNGEPVHHEIVKVPCQLVVRASCGSPTAGESTVRMTPTKPTPATR
jgi:LacI family transcriptional regulator